MSIKYCAVAAVIVAAAVAVYTCDKKKMTEKKLK